MGWLKEKYTREYFLQRKADGTKLPYGVDGVEFWEKGALYPAAKSVLDPLDFRGARVLDIGPGRGDAMRYCLEAGAAHVTGVDFAEPAVELSRATLQHYPHARYRLVLDDVLNFVQTCGPARFSHILMIDVIEHIPRKEVDLLLPYVFSCLRRSGFLVIHTPLYEEDDDVLLTGGKLASRDSSDEFEETRGMHINRYSDASLGAQLGRFGFKRWNSFLFLRPRGWIPFWRYRWKGRTRILPKLAKFFGYKFK